ncbi:MAG: hypothetical protein E6G60_06330 [Actinobacteria bacterium]|nr:MAG: hypothetical protein E6G60_06330 [Actinomycetota bacterium]
MEEWRAPERRTVPRLLAQQSQRYGPKVLLYVDGEPLTYADLAERAHAVANGLFALGVRPGDRVAIYLETSAEYAAAWFGAALLGAISVPLNLANRGAFLAHQLADCGAEVALVEASLLDRVLEVAPHVPGLRIALLRGSGAHPQEVGALRIGAFDELLGHGTGPLTAVPEPVWDQPVSIVYT